MSISFEKAPLVELIAECRWGPQHNLIEFVAQQPVQLFQLPGGTKVEEYFTRLGGELYRAGFQRSERLVPPGFPTLPNQPVIRYRTNDSPTSSILFQAGTGLFSIHAIPPYHSWREFLPFVEVGIDALLKSRDESERGEPIALITLRYIDLFAKELTQGLSVVRFITDVLGFSLGLPGSILGVSETKEATSINLTFVLPIANATMTVMVADGTAGNRSGVVMNSSITSKQSVNPQIARVLEFLNYAHDILHTAFMGMTAPIHEAMVQRGEANQ